MFVNVSKLRGKMTECEYSVEDVAKLMGIDKSTLYRKLENGGAGLSVKDANQLMEILHLTNDEAIAIFFARQVA